jgi:hypothetical protein
MILAVDDFHEAALAVRISSSVDSGRANAYASMASASLRSGNELKAGHGETTEPGQRGKAVALVDVRHLIKSAAHFNRRLPINFRYPPFATEIA